MVKFLYVGQKTINKILILILVTSIIALSASNIYVLVKNMSGEMFTEFYILDPNGKTSDYPTDLKVGEEGKVIIGIVNHERESVTYRLEINLNGSLIHEELVYLIENEKLEIPFTFRATNNGKNQKLEFLLYKDQQMEAYRKLHLWVSVT